VVGITVTHYKCNTFVIIVIYPQWDVTTPSTHGGMFCRGVFKP
jgi:hypothetical protein